MGKYSSDSDSSGYSRKKKSRRHRSSSHSSSSSRFSSRSKKSKKHRRSRSSERSSKHRRRSREGSSSKSRKHKNSKRSRRRSRSSSHSKLSSNRSPTYSSRSHSKDTRSPPYSYGRRRSRSRSTSVPSRSYEKKSPLFDGAELLAKLNRAATEAMAENSKKLESLFSENAESRNNAINEINAPNFVQKAFCSSDRKEDGPVVADVTNFVSFNTVKEEPGTLLHPNLLIEDQVEKTNRWVKKLFQIRQKSLYGDPLAVD